MGLESKIKYTISFISPLGEVYYMFNYLAIRETSKIKTKYNKNIILSEDNYFFYFHGD